MNDAVYGKTLENIRKRGNYKMVFDKNEAQKIIDRRFFKNYIAILQECVLIEQYNQKTILNKPIQLGMTILDMQKYQMYDFYYNHIKKFLNYVKLIYQDTDSLVLQIKTKDDIYNNMIKNNQYYDFSKVNKKSPFYNKLQEYYNQQNMNKQQIEQFITDRMAIGKFKDESINDPITSFVAIRSKCYSYVTVSDKHKKRNKGIKQCVVQNDLTHKDYQNCLQNNEIKQITQYGLRSYHHNIYTIQQQKIALVNMNDKCYQIDQNNSLALGNYRIQC